MKEQELLQLVKSYSKDVHEKLLPKLECDILDKLEYIYDTTWTNVDNAPYEILTYLADCYYSLPQRPDLASLFCWQAINNSYNEMLILNGARRLIDTRGIEKLIDSIMNNSDKYFPILHNFAKKLNEKLFHFVSSYLLKGYVCDCCGVLESVIPSAYTSVIKVLPELKRILENSYGKAFTSITRPAINNAQLKLNIDPSDTTKGINIRRCFSKSLKDLLDKHETKISDFQSRQERQYCINDKDELFFLLCGILYASRCNNFHGNVPSRLNTLYADENSYKSYINIFLLEYEVLAVSLNIQGKLSDSELSRIGKNVNLMLPE